MKALRVIFLAGLISALAGSAFGQINQNGTNQNGIKQNVVPAPEIIDFHGSFKYQILLLAGAGGGILLLERRRRRHRDPRDK